MKTKEYEALREKFLKETLELSDTKRIEYTESNYDDNVLWNFDNIANALNLEPEQVLAVYLSKHLSSLNNYLKTATTYAEPIEGRIQDIINYLLLLIAMIQRKENQS